MEYVHTPIFYPCDTCGARTKTLEALSFPPFSHGEKAFIGPRKMKTEPPTKAVSGNLLMLPKSIKRSSRLSCRILTFLWARWSCFNNRPLVGKINRQSIHRTKWVRLCRAFSSLVLKIEQLQGWDTGLMEYVTIELIEQFKWVYCEQNHLVKILKW